MQLVYHYCMRIGPVCAQELGGVWQLKHIGSMACAMHKVSLLQYHTRSCHKSEQRINNPHTRPERRKVFAFRTCSVSTCRAVGSPVPPLHLHWLSWIHVWNMPLGADGAVHGDPSPRHRVTFSLGIRKRVVDCRVMAPSRGDAQAVGPQVDIATEPDVVLGKDRPVTQDQ